MISSARAAACVLGLLAKRLNKFTLLQILFLANREYKTVWGKNLLSDFYESDDFFDTSPVLPDLIPYFKRGDETCVCGDFDPQERICKTTSSFRYLRKAALHFEKPAL